MLCQELQSEFCYLAMLRRRVDFRGAGAAGNGIKIIAADIWRGNTLEYLKAFSESMPKGTAAEIDDQGRPTKVWYISTDQPWALMAKNEIVLIYDRLYAFKMKTQSVQQQGLHTTKD